jgi:hypothetical protein
LSGVVEKLDSTRDVINFHRSKPWSGRAHRVIGLTCGGDLPWGHDIRRCIYETNHRVTELPQVSGPLAPSPATGSPDLKSSNIAVSSGP